MNINTLSEIIKYYNREIIETGFQRDLQDYIKSLGNNQNNIIYLREIATNISKKLNDIYENDLPESLNKLLVNSIKPFTNHPHDEDLKQLIIDKEITLQQFYQKLSQILSNLNNKLLENTNEINRLNTFVAPYVSLQEDYQKEENKAIISILFKDSKTTTILKEFTKNIQSWNKVLPLYHQILKSDSPQDIEIVTVQNGSIDFVLNLDMDIALDLTEVFKIGFKSFMAYLSYKKMAQPIIESYYGNKKLIDGEKEREKELINNIGEAVKNKIVEQHKNAIKKDKKIDLNGDKKIEQVTKLVTSHIMKGNDVKLISIPQIEEKTDEVNQNLKDELRTISSGVRQAMKLIPGKEMKMLLEKYTDTENTEE